MGFPCGSADKESTCNAEGLGSISRLGRYLGEGKGYPLQYPGLENSMDCTVHGVAKSDMTEQLSHEVLLGHGQTMQIQNKVSAFWRDYWASRVLMGISFDPSIILLYKA